MNNNNADKILAKLINEGIYDNTCKGILIDYAREGDYIRGKIYSRSIPSVNGEEFLTRRVTNIIEYGKHKKAFVENKINGYPSVYILYNSVD